MTTRRLAAPGPIGSEARATIALALPSVGAQLAAMGQNTAEIVLAGHMDADVLGAVSVGEAVWAFGFLAAIGLANALPPMVAQLDGAGRRAQVGAVFRQALWLALATGGVLAAMVGAVGPVLVRAMVLDPVLARGAAGFLLALSPGVPALPLFLACRGLSDGLAMPRAGLVAALGGLAVIVPVGGALMYGWFGLPSLGARGFGIAAAIVLWLQLAGLAAWLRWSGRYAGLGAGPLGPDWRAIAALLRLGGPMAVSVLLEASLFSVSALAIARFGVVASAGHQIALGVAALAFMVPLGLSTAVTVRVGQAAGRGDRRGARRAGLTGLGLAVGFECATCGLFLLAPHPIVALFTGDAAVAAAAVPLLRLAGVFQLSDGLQVVASGALRGMKDVVVPMGITAVAYWGVGLPAALLLAFDAGWRAPGLWMGLIGGLTTAAVLLSCRFLAVTRQGATVGAVLPQGLSPPG